MPIDGPPPQAMGFMQFMPPSETEGKSPGQAEGFLSQIENSPSPEAKGNQGPSPSSDKLPSVLSKARVVLEVCTPISSRGILVLVIAAPIYLAIGLGKGISEMISKGSVSAFRKGFIKGAGGLKKQAHGGISDSYTDLTSKKNKVKGAEIAKENLHYAESLDGKGTKIGNKMDVINKIDGTKEKAVSELMDEIEGLGFKTDDSKIFHDPKTGSAFYLTVNKEKNEIILCFLGMGAEHGLKSEENKEIKGKMGNNCIKQVVSESLGYPSKASIQAIKLGKALKKCTDVTKDTPVAVGHSHGGSLAQCAAVANGIKGVAFNSQPMGAGTRRFIGQKKIAKNSRHITAFSGKGDWLSQNKALNVTSVLFERVTGLPVPRTIGKGYNLPKGEGAESSMDSHIYYTEQLKALLKN